MNTLWFSLAMARDQFKKILRAFHIVDNSTIPSKDDPAYRPKCRVRPLLDYIRLVITITSVHALLYTRSSNCH